MGIIDYQRGESYLHKMDPRIKLIALVLLSIVVFILSNIIVVAALTIILVLLWNSARLSWTALLKFGKVVMSIMALIVVMQMLFYGAPETSHYMFGLRVPPNSGFMSNFGPKWEGFEFGILLTVRFMCLMILMPMVIKTTPVHVFALGMVKLGLPYRVAYMTTTALNMIPTFQEETGVIIDAQKMRGMTVFEEGKTSEKMKAYPALVVPLIIGAMRRAQQMAVAMDTRAFGYKKHRTYIDKISMKRSDWVTSVGIFVLAGVLIACNYMLPRTILQFFVQ